VRSLLGFYLYGVGALIGGFVLGMLYEQSDD
jgi:hypothetical protein